MLLKRMLALFSIMLILCVSANCSTVVSNVPASNNSTTITNISVSSNNSTALTSTPANSNNISTESNMVTGATSTAVENGADEGESKELDDVKKLIVTAEDAVGDLLDYNDNSNSVIGKFDDVEVTEYLGKNNTFDEIKQKIGMYFTDNVIELELQKQGYTNINGKIGSIEATGAIVYNIHDDSAYRLISATNKKRIVEIQAFNDGSDDYDVVDESKLVYTITKQADGKWKISDEKGCFETEQNPVKIGYLKSWSKIDASSSVKNYPAQFAFDGDLNTTWAVKNGVGEWIRFTGKNEQAVSGIEIINGYAKSEELYIQNNRAKKIMIQLSDGSSFEKVLEDDPSMSFQKVDFGKKIETSSVKITILDVYRYDDTKYNETCISEVRIY